MSRKLLMVATVTNTVTAFLLPFAEHFRSLGWTVDAAAAGIVNEPKCTPHFDHTWEMPWSRRPRDPANWQAVGEIRRIVAQGEYDLVHVHTPVAGFVTRFALRELRGKRNLKVVYTAHGLHCHPRGKALANAIFCNLEKLCGRWADALVVINREDFQYAQKHGLASHGSLYHMPGIGVDLDYFSPDLVPSGAVDAVRAEIGLTPADKVFLMVAEFIPRKRHPDAVKAFGMIQDRGAHLVLVGDGPDMDEVAALVHRMGLADKVHLLGSRGDVPVLLAAASAIVLPSSQEGLPRAVLEAMAMGTPVIGSRIRGTAELLEDGCGLLVELGDVEALAAAMRTIVNDPAAAAAMARRARNKAEGHSLAKILALHEQMYRSLLS